MNVTGRDPAVERRADQGVVEHRLRPLGIGRRDLETSARRDMIRLRFLDECLRLVSHRGGRTHFRGCLSTVGIGRLKLTRRFIRHLLAERSRCDQFRHASRFGLPAVIDRLISFGRRFRFRDLRVCRGDRGLGHLNPRDRLLDVGFRLLDQRELLRVLLVQLGNGQLTQHLSRNGLLSRRVVLRSRHLVAQIDMPLPNVSRHLGKQRSLFKRLDLPRLLDHPHQRFFDGLDRRDLDRRQCYRRTRRGSSGKRHHARSLLAPDSEEDQGNTCDSSPHGLGFLIL